MANFTKPSDVPNWATTAPGPDVVDPGAAKSNLGWIVDESPPHSFFNFLQKLYGEWHGWIDERFFDGATNDDLAIKALAITGTDVDGGQLDIEGGSSAGSGGSVVRMRAAVSGATGATPRLAEDFLSADGVNDRLVAKKSFVADAASGDDGLVAVGDGSGVGLRATGGAVGIGLLAQGGGTSGGIEGRPGTGGGVGVTGIAEISNVNSNGVQGTVLAATIPQATAAIRGINSKSTAGTNPAGFFQSTVGNAIRIAGNTTRAHINLSDIAGDPTALANGDIWFDDGVGFRGRVAGGSVTFGSVFGSELTAAESLGVTSQASSTPLNKLTLTIPAGVPLGTYRINWSYVWASSSASSRFLARIQLNNVGGALDLAPATNAMDHSEAPKNAGTLVSNPVNTEGGYFDIVATGSPSGNLQWDPAGSVPLDLDFASASATAYIAQARMTFSRIA